MPEPRRGRALAALVVIAFLGIAAAPAVLAQTSEPDPAAWEGSRFTDPFDEGTATVTGESFPLAGLFTKERQPGEQIVRVDVVFDGNEEESVDTTSPTTEPPAEEPSDVSCVPEDQEFVGGGTVSESGETATYEFTVPEEESVWPCNGRYGITATAATGAGQTHEISAVLTVAVPPRPVTVIDARVLDGDRDVEITWEPLADDDLAVDAAGYRVERAGPGTSEGAFGDFASVGSVGLDADPRLTDRPTKGGVYRYRVRALRDGADGPVPSPVEGTAFDDATVAGEPEAESTTTTRPSRSRIGAGTRPPSRRSATPSLKVPTTVDPGFENELDYGDREPGSPELAGDSGRSIIQTDDTGVGLAAPVAGALVLLGWAGHLAYLNRLAKQF